MSHIRPYALEHAENAYQSNVGNQINSLQPRSGKGIKITSHNNSHLIEATQTYKRDCMVNKGTFDYNAEYFVNDVVVVTQSISGSQLGTYVCINYVPPAVMDSTLLIGTIAPNVASWGGTITQDYANGYRHYNNNIYYPTTKKLGPETSVPESYWTVTASQSFWQQLGSSGNQMWTVYNESASYSVGDEVLVDPNNNPAYTVQGPATSSAPLCYGLFQCLVPVPAYNSASSNGGRNIGSAYYPIYPTIPSSSLVTVSGSTYNQNYWFPISPMFASQVCINGLPITIYVNGIKSGSVFNSTLPYP